MSSFVYVTYIRTTPEKLWNALTKPEFQRQYWFGMHQESGWTPGSPWAMKFEDGRVADEGEILEAEAPKRLVIKWRNAFRPELTAEGFSRCEITLEQTGEMVKLSIAHTIENGPQFIQAVSGGWPKIMASLKTLLETGASLPRFD